VIMGAIRWDTRETCLPGTQPEFSKGGVEVMEAKAMKGKIACD